MTMIKIAMFTKAYQSDIGLTKKTRISLKNLKTSLKRTCVSTSSRNNSKRN